MQDDAPRRTAASRRTTQRRPPSGRSAADRSRSRGPETLGAGSLVAGRYRLGDVLGRGGASVVHAAVEEPTGAQVAVKLLHGEGIGTRPRVRREVAALRLLRVPGVVSLLMSGNEGMTPFLVMERVDGHPFPGRGRTSWERIAPVTLSFLETLARVHSAGVVHRDLKPSNVLVGDDGRVTLLDFGVSWGPALGRALTALGTVVGTPEYLAPEQILGRAADPRTDLYAVGVMLYEALSGRLPHESHEFARLVEMKRHTPPTPLRYSTPQAPREVAEVVDRLLSIDPLDRPQTAGEVSRLLFGTEPDTQLDVPLPRLGGTEILDRIVEDALAGRSTDLFGPVGSGRTRLLSDVADRLEAAGRRVHWVLPAQQAWASLAPVVGGFEDLRSATRAEAEAAIASRLADLLRSGTVVIADDAPLLDSSSALALAAARRAGVVLRTFERPVEGGTEVRALTAEQLRPLFAGPDRLLHLREDGAEEIWRRTGGLPALVVAEVAAWTRAGIAEWGGGLVRIGRGALDRLRGGLSVGDELLLRPGRRARTEPLDELLAWIALAWPHATLDVLAQASGEPRWRLESEVEDLVADGLARLVGDGRVQPLVMPHALEIWSDDRRRDAHRSLAETLPPGTPLRIRHFVAAGLPEEAIGETIALTPALVRAGRPADARVLLTQALEVCRDHTTSGTVELLVLQSLTWACAAEGAVSAIDRALYEIGRSHAPQRRLRTLEAFLRGAREATGGDAKGAIRLLARIGALDSMELELWRHAMRIRAATRLGVEALGPVVRDAEAWAAGTSHPRAAMNLAAWQAIEAQMKGEFATAARLHAEASETTTNEAARAVSLLNAATAFEQIGEFDAATSYAERALRCSLACRRALYEAHSIAVLRDVAYRSGGLPDPDDELASVVARFGDPYLEGKVNALEAACAWRRGDPGRAREFAARACAAWGRAKDTAHANAQRALALAAGADGADAEVESIAAAAASGQPDALQAETLALLAVARPARAEELRRGAAAILAAAPLPEGARGMVLCAEEVTGVTPLPPPPNPGDASADAIR